jgi:hypothetical protein
MIRVTKVMVRGVVVVPAEVIGELSTKPIRSGFNVRLTLVLDHNAGRNTLGNLNPLEVFDNPLGNPELHSVGFRNLKYASNFTTLAQVSKDIEAPRTVLFADVRAVGVLGEELVETGFTLYNEGAHHTFEMMVETDFVVAFKPSAPDGIFVLGDILQNQLRFLATTSDESCRPELEYVARVYFQDE